MPELPAPLAGRFLIRRLAWVLGAAAVVTMSLAVFGAEHTPNYTFNLFGFAATNGFSLKSKVATGILALALLQLLLALWIYGKAPGGVTPPHHVRTVHRICGIVLFLATCPSPSTACMPMECKRPRPGSPSTRWPGASSTAHSWPRSSSFEAGGCRVGSSRLQVACSLRCRGAVVHERPLVLRRVPPSGLNPASSERRRDVRVPAARTDWPQLRRLNRIDRLQRRA